MDIFETIVKSIGKQAKEFQKDKMIILCGKNVPEMLANYCYTIELSSLKMAIKSNQLVSVDHRDYKITAVGSIVSKNLEEMGHITLQFDGSTSVTLPGTLHIEKMELPGISVGSKISIRDV